MIIIIDLYWLMVNVAEAVSVLARCIQVYTLNTQSAQKYFQYNAE